MALTPSFFLFFFFFFSSLTLVCFTRAQERAPHGLAHENPVAFSPSAVDFFHPRPQEPNGESPCAASSSCSPLPLPAQSVVATDQARKISTSQKGGNHRLRAGGAAGFVLGVAFAVLLTVAVYHLMVLKMNGMRLGKVLPFNIAKEPIPCSCDMLKKIADREEKEKVMQFLMGLNEPYSQIHGSILMMNPMPDTRKAHGLILQQERQMEVAARNSTVPASHAMQVARRGGSQTVTSFGSKKFCTHCEQGGHLVDQCYYLIGFPIGHKWHGKNVKPRNKKTTINNIEVKRESANESPTFTAEEYKQIMALLKNGNNQPFANATGHFPRPTPLKVYSRRPQPTDSIPSDPLMTTPHSPVPPMDPSMTPLTDITEPPMVDPIQILHEPRHSTRLHRPPPYLQDFQTYHATVLGPNVSSASMSSTRYPLQRNL
ncbi:hypothetical protein DKX38_013652 [Salix brachista]|uniref:Uncharacterized protein n=1 Tax=Salix brachista TaxID=2182728 RepID=A0A5N5LDW0_9ROSI|nr:hypothetical protein DKX38_013652 [Salix brachista]